MQHILVDLPANGARAIDHGCTHVAMPQQRLDRADIVAVLEQMRRERVTEGVVITSMLSLWPASIGSGRTLRKSPGGYTPGVDDQRRRGRELAEMKES
jgi:hypothetical protein